MKSFYIISQIIIILGIFNVWLIRFNKPTQYRGGSSTNLKEEFHNYGYPSWFFYTIGCLKISFALIMILGFWLQYLTTISSLGIVILMLGAVVSHLKVKDTLTKFIPAIIMVSLSSYVFVASLSL